MDCAPSPRLGLTSRPRRPARSRVRLLVVLALLAATPVSAQAPERAGAITEALELSGIRQALESLPQQIDAQLDEYPLSPEALPHARTAMRQAFRPERFLAAIRSEVERRWDAGRMTAALMAMRTPLARRIAALELDAVAPERQPDVRAYALRLQSMPPSPARLALVRRLDAASGATRLNVELGGATLRGLMAGVASALPSQDRPSPDQIEALVRQTLKELEPVVRAGAELVLLFAYRSLGDDELAAYAAQTESEPVRWFLDGANAGFLAAARDAGREAGRLLERTLGPRA